MSQTLYGDDTRQRFNVLNLGVDGYGVDQAFLYYNDFGYSSELDVVLYVFCVNDLRGIYETGLFSLNESGALTPNFRTETSSLISLLSGLHITYLVMDGVQRLANLVRKRIPDHAKEAKANFEKEWQNRRGGTEAIAIQHNILRGMTDSEGGKAVVRVFQSILRTWKHAVEERGGQFIVVILPRPPEDQAAVLIPPEVRTTNLFRCFDDHVTEYDFVPPWRFVSDSHWAEQGNMLAALCLYRFLARELNLPARSDGELLAQVHKYYLAFQDDAYARKPVDPTSTHAADSVDLDLSPGRRYGDITTNWTWMPPDEWTRPVLVQPGELTAIRMKYLAAARFRTAAESAK